MPDEPTKTQRWIDLIACLLERRRPMTVEQIFASVPGYGDAVEAPDGPTADSVRRKFERDKDELRELGIPIDTVEERVGFGLEVREGYRLRPDAFYLPRLAGDRPSAGRGQAARAVAPGDLPLALDALREAADIPEFPLAAEARSAFRKLSFDLGDIDDGTPLRRIPPSGAAELGRILALLSDALLRRKRVTFRYHGLARGEATDRDVAPYGLVLERGAWYLVGRDALRDALRMFHVGRMEGPRVNSSAPATPDYDIPADFRLADHRGRGAWELPGGGDTLRARVRFEDPDARWAARNRFGSLESEEADGSAVRSFEVSLAPPFLGWLLGRRGRARLLQPPELVGQLRDIAAGIRAAHEPVDA